MAETPILKTIDFLEENPEIERSLRAIRDFIVEKVREAAASFSGNLNRRAFTNHLKAMWENDGHRAKPRFKVQFDPNEKPITVIFEGESEYDFSSRTIRINLDPLAPSQFAQHKKIEPVAALNRIAQSIFHEVEHIHYPGADSPYDRSPAAQIEYMANPGEIRAFARQFAYLYSQRYPGDIFNLEKMQALALESGDGRAINYFNSFADPEKQARYAEFGDIKKVHETIVSLTERFVDHGLTGKYRGALKSALAEATIS